MEGQMEGKGCPERKMKKLGKREGGGDRMKGKGLGLVVAMLVMLFGPSTLAVIGYGTPTAGYWFNP